MAVRKHISTGPAGRTDAHLLDIRILRAHRRIVVDERTLFRDMLRRTTPRDPVEMPRTAVGVASLLSLLDAPGAAILSTTRCNGGAPVQAAYQHQRHHQCRQSESHAEVLSRCPTVGVTASRALCSP